MEQSAGPESALDVDRIAGAAQAIDPVFRDSPQFVDGGMCAALGREVLVKIETLNPLRSFKGRGADWFVRGLPDDRPLVCASSGNFGQAMAWACRRRGIPLEVVVAADVNPVKAARMRSMGAVVRVADGDLAGEVRERERAGLRAVVDGDEPAVAEGAGTIAVELERSAPVDALVVPVGDGALISGVASWTKVHAPGTRIIGVCAAGAPSMARSWAAGRVVRAGAPETIAEGLAIAEPVPRAVQRVRALVDDMVLVPDAALVAAMRLCAETLGVLVEPSGAAGIAAIAVHDLPGDRLATVLTGGDPRPDLLPEVLRAGPRGVRPVHAVARGATVR